MPPHGGLPRVKLSERSWGEGTEGCCLLPLPCKQEAPITPKLFSPEAGCGPAAKRGESIAKVLSKHGSAVLAQYAAVYFPPENKRMLNSSLDLLGSLFLPSCPLAHCCWVQVWKVYSYLFLMLLKCLLSGWKGLWAELLGIALLLSGSCRVASAHCCALAKKSMLFLAKTIPSNLAKVVETSDFIFFSP